MTPKLGSTVLYTLNEGERPVNYSRTFPAIVTCTHGGENDLVNLRVFLDTDPNDPAGADEWRTSVERGEAGEPGRWAPAE